MTALSDNESRKSWEEAWLRILEELLYSTQGAISERVDEGEPRAVLTILNNRQCWKFSSENNLTRRV